MFEEGENCDSAGREFKEDWQAKAARWALGAVRTHQALMEMGADEFEAYARGAPDEVWKDLDGFLQTRLQGTNGPFVGRAGWEEFERFCHLASLPECLFQLCQGRSGEEAPAGFETRRFEFVASKIIEGMKGGASAGVSRFTEAVCRSGLADAKALAYYCPEAFGAFMMAPNPLLEALADGFARLSELGGEEARRGFFLLAQAAPWTYDPRVSGAQRHIENFDGLMKAGCPFPVEAQAEFFAGVEQESGADLELRAKKAKEWMIDSGRVDAMSAQEVLSRTPVMPGWARAMLEAKAMEVRAPSSRGRDMRI